MSQPTEQQLIQALRRADDAGDTQAAQAIARRIQSVRQAQRDPGNAIQQVGRGVGLAARNLASGLADAGATALDRGVLAPIDFATGGWDLPEQARAQFRDSQESVRQANETANQDFNQNATGLERAGKIGGDIAAFFLPADKINKAAKGAQMLPRVAAQALGAMGADAVMQQGEGAENLDAGRLALTGAFGGGGELAAPWLARAGKGVLSRIRQASDNPLDQGRAIAAKAGIVNAPDEVLVKLSAAADEIEAGADPGAVLAKYEFGFDVSRGQMTGNAKQIQLEENLRDIGGNAVTRADARNIEQMDELRRVFSDNLDSPANAMDRVQTAVQGAERAAMQQADKAWKGVRHAAQRGPDATGAAAPASIVDDFVSRTQAAWDEAGEVVEGSLGGLNQKVHNAVKSIEQTLRNSIDRDGTVDFAALVAARKKFGATYKSVEPGSRAALGIARQQFDNVLTDLTEETLARGSIDDIANMHKAVGHTREYKRLFENKDNKVGKAVMRMVSDDNIGELSQAMLGDSPVTRPAALNYIRAVKQVLGDDAPALDEFRRSVMFKAMTRRGAEGQTMRSTAINLKEMMHGKNRKMMDELFTKKELSKIDRFTQALDSMTFRPDYTGRNSGTPGGLIRAVRRMAEGTPIIGDMIGILNNVSDARAARAAMQPLRVNPGLPAAPAALAATNPSQPTRP